MDSNIYHSIIIAKGLSYIDPNMKRCIQFWKYFKSVFADSKVIKKHLRNMKWSEFGNILFTISQIKILSSDFEWRVIVEVFRERMLSNYDQEKIIKGITSLSLA